MRGRVRRILAAPVMAAFVVTLVLAQPGARAQGTKWYPWPVLSYYGSYDVSTKKASGMPATSLAGPKSEMWTPPTPKKPYTIGVSFPHLKDSYWLAVDYGIIDEAKQLGVGINLVAAAFEFDFMGGSMGSVVGERFVRGVHTAIEQKVPFLCFTATGGARMQEGLLSLMQMAKTTAMLTKLSEKKLPFISVLTDPTTGGVSASFAFMGDVVIAEPKALIGFAGPRVIENTVREKLPEGFQRAEFLVQKGAVDMIVDRRKMREEIARLLALLQSQPADVIA